MNVDQTRFKLATPGSAVRHTLPTALRTRRLLSDLHKNLLLNAFSITTELFIEFEEKGLKLSNAKGVRTLNALSPMEIFIMMLIEV